MTNVFALVQIPLALGLIWHCCQVRHLTAPGFIRDTLLLSAASGGGIIAWCLTTLLIVNDPAHRYNGSMAVLTLFIIVVFLLVHAVGQLAKKK